MSGMALRSCVGSEGQSQQVAAFCLLRHAAAPATGGAGDSGLRPPVPATGSAGNSGLRPPAATGGAGPVAFALCRPLAALVITVAFA